MGILQNAKEIADLVKAIGDIELYRKIVELEGEIIDLTRAKRELEEANRESKGQLELKAKMFFKKPFWYTQDDPHALCPRCWEKEKVAIHLIGPTQTMGAIVAYDCPACKAVYYPS